MSIPPSPPTATAATADSGDRVSGELAALLDEHIAQLRARGADEMVLAALVADLHRLAG